MGDPSGDGEGFGFGLPGTVGGASAAPLMKHGRWNATDVVVEYHRTMWRDATKNSRRVYVHNLNTAIIGVDAKDELGKTLHDAVMVAGRGAVARRRRHGEAAPEARRADGSRREGVHQR